MKAKTNDKVNFFVKLPLELHEKVRRGVFKHRLNFTSFAAEAFRRELERLDKEGVAAK